MQKRYFIWLEVILLIGAGVWGAVKLASYSPSGPTANVLAINDSDWTLGNKTAKAVLIEYGDFQCPACAAYFPTVKQILNEYEGRIFFVYRHFPLPQHKWARPAAYASEAAGKQGKFWKMYEKLYYNQSRWSESNNADEIFTEYAKDLGLGMEKYKADLDSSSAEDKVDADYASGVRAVVNSTPTFFLNGKKIQPRNYPEFKALIDEALR